MSLIQEALEKAGRLPDYKLETSAEFPQPPLGPKEEKSRDILQFLKALLSAQVLRRGILAALLLLLFAGISKLLVALPKKFPQKSISKAGANGRSLFPAAPILQKNGFRLTGITYSAGEGPIALINDQIVGVGARLKGDTVVKEIHRRSVTLESRGSTIKLTL